MSNHTRLHGRLLRGAFLAVCLAVLATGCNSATRPRVNVLGVQETRSAPRSALLVFVEVVNPTSRPLTLSRLQYRVSATSWFESAGQVRLTREVDAESSAVVEIPVPVERAASTDDGRIPYVLVGKLYAQEDGMERSWDVAVKGALGSAQTGDRGSPIRVTVVDP
jgi:hypothetical protein